MDCFGQLTKVEKLITWPLTLAFCLRDDQTHIGFERTYDLARLQYYFPGMYQFLRSHVLTCEVCQKTESNTHPQKAEIDSVKPATIGDRWFSDVFGPFS